jgi:hypothetical protein
MRVLRLLVILGLAGLAATVTAGPHKVIVLPLDGSADPALKAKLDAIVRSLAKAIPGDVTVGDATFSETATAVGCDPNKASCVDTMLSTLAVDEIVWGNVTSGSGGTAIVVKRATKGERAHEQTVLLTADEPPEAAEPRLSPEFGVAASSPPAGRGSAKDGTSESSSLKVGATESGSVKVGATESGSAKVVATGSGSTKAAATGSASVTATASGSGSPPAPAEPWSSQKKLGVGLAIGGGALVVLGLSLWATEDSLQGDIDTAPVATGADITHLKDLESRANGYAWGGNIVMLLGLGAGGYGAYLLWKDHKEHTVVTPAPPPTGTGMTFVLRGAW